MATDFDFVVWNMAHRVQNWEHIDGPSVALLTEAVAPPDDLVHFPQTHGVWNTAGEKRRRWSTAVAWQADAPVEVIDFEPSRGGTLTAVVYDSRLIMAACYATWEPDPDHPEWKEGRSDLSALALAGDLALLKQQLAMPIIAAGDWNLWPASYPNAGGCSVIAPVEAELRKHGVHRVALEGEQIQEGHRASTFGRLPACAIPTYDHGRRGSPRYEVDHVFASEELTVRAEARNSVADWGASDHCQIRVRGSARH